MISHFPLFIILLRDLIHRLIMIEYNCSEEESMFAKLKTAWRAFNHWRRSAFTFRLTVLLIILVVFPGGLLERAMTENHSPLIFQWVWDYCLTMRNAFEPQVESAYLHYYRARENQRLQNELRCRIQNGLQLSPDDLSAVNAMPSKIDNKLMFDIGKSYGIISAGVSPREYMRTLWAASLSMTAMEFDKDWDDVKQEMFSNDKLFRGEREWWMFSYALAEILPLPLEVTVPWFILCLALAFITAKDSDRKWRKMMAVLLPVIFTLLLFTSRSTVYGVYNLLCLDGGVWGMYIAIYFLVLSVIAGILGIRLKHFLLKHNADDIVQVLLLLVAGALLMFPFSFFPESHHFYYRDGFLPGYILLCDFSSGMTLLFCLSGAVMECYAIKSYFQMQATGRFKRFRIPPELLCYLLWGITVAWACYLLSRVDYSAFNLFFFNLNALSINIPVSCEWECSETAERAMALGLSITAFIGSIIYGLLMNRPVIKRCFRNINICAMILLITIFAVLTLFISCSLQWNYFPDNKGSYMKVSIIWK